MRRRTTNRDRSGDSAEISYSDSLRKAGSRSRWMKRPCHSRSNSINLGGKPHISADISQRCIRTRRNCGGGGDDCRGVGEYSSHGAGPWEDIYGGGSAGVTVQQWELGGDGGDAKVHGGIPPLGGQADHGYEGNTWGMQGVVISPIGGGTVILRTTPHNGVHY